MDSHKELQLEDMDTSPQNEEQIEDGSSGEPASNVTGTAPNTTTTTTSSTASDTESQKPQASPPQGNDPVQT